MDDLVQRLRIKCDHQTVGCAVCNYERTEAADRIERLEAALRKLLDASDQYDSAWDQDDAAIQYGAAKRGARRALDGEEYVRHLRNLRARIERLEAALRKADEWFDNMETFDSADEGLSIIKLDAAAYQRMEAVGDALRRALDVEGNDPVDNGRSERMDLHDKLDELFPYIKEFRALVSVLAYLALDGERARIERLEAALRKLLDASDQYDSAWDQDDAAIQYGAAKRGARRALDVEE